MKHIKRLIMILVPIVVLSSCAKTSDDDLMGSRSFSVLGDSYSTYEGFVRPETNDVWPHYDRIGVNSVEQMWWYQVIKEKGWKLEQNNSFSGSLICNLDYANYYGRHSFLHRMDSLGSPDVIFIFGGTNDSWDEAPLGEYIYSDWTEEDLCTFRPALAYLLESLKVKHPKATLYFMLDYDLGPEFITSVHNITRYCQVKCIDMYSVSKDWGHPDAQGMDDIAEYVLDALK